ncbi:MAG: DinB family protein, partial [Chloroflexota bacterium]|nr:DinB family protein [Chloroflexota bacterium]
MTEPAASPDPVSSPDAYREAILGWLGDADPAVVQAGTTAKLRATVEAAGGRLRDRPAPTEWSVIECVGHLLDSEIVTAARVRWITAEDEPAIIGYDQDRWVDGLRHRDDDPDDLIALFDALRTADLRLWAASPASTRERVGIHSERG